MNASTVLPLRPDRVTPRHLDRLAVVYVRQSTLRQVQQHQESTRLQYGLTERAVALGWPRERVVIIDDDLGKSAASAEGRPGFQRLVADVGLDRVGIVVGLDMSRLARSCKDWYHLLEVCALFGTLIADLDGLYDPSQYNDRLLLGLKGTMSEAELHTLRQRLLTGQRAKAKRGELVSRVPMGYARRASGEVILDPDERARQVISMIFGAFDRTGTIHGVLRYLVENDIRLPVRAHAGPDKGELQWSRPNSASVNNLLHNPTYAGVYTWGRRPSDPRRQQAGRPRTGRRTADPDKWLVCLQDRLPAYITWQQFQTNQVKIQSNRLDIRGTPRQGSSLLAGLVRCGKCGRRMLTSYSGRQQILRYSCMMEAMHHLGEPCQSLCGKDLDRMVEEQVLQAVQPAALQVSLQVAVDFDAERQQMDKHWRQRLEHAHYQADRARRHYLAVEPENRMVARQLETEWNQALAAQAQLQDEHERYLAQRPAALTATERAAIEALACDIPKVWHAPTTTMQDRRAIVAMMVERVVVTVVGQTEHVDVVVHWQGGYQSQGRLRRPLRYGKNMSDSEVFAARAIALRKQGLDLAQTAEVLNREGFHAPRGGPVNGSTVHASLSRQGLTRKNRPADRKANDQQPDEVPLVQAAERIGMPAATLRIWIDNGKAHGRVARDYGAPKVLVRLDEQELQRLRESRREPARGKRPSRRADKHEDAL
jgi:DNA invertase Pin-like site-specific DNA recombinase